MKVLHIIQRYLPAQLSGSEKAMVILCESLASETDNTIQVATSDVGPGEGFYIPTTPRITAHREKINGVAVVRLPVAWLKSALYYIANRLTAGRIPILKFRSFGPELKNLAALIKQEQPDLIHAAPLPMNHVYQAWQLAKTLSLPFVVTPTMHFEDPRFDNPILYELLYDANQIIAHTSFEKQKLITLGIDEAKIAIIPSSYLQNDDFERGSAESFRREYQLGDKPVVLFLGSKSFDKGAVHLLEAWPEVLRQVRDAILIIAGVPTTTWLETKKTNSAHVIELDYIDEQTKHDALKACNVVCIPSRTESFGMILLEAWAKAKPVIGGSAGATRELIEEGENGYTVTFGDTKAFADQVIGLLLDNEKATRLGQAGFKKAKQFTKSVIVKKTVEAYQKAVNQKRA